MDIRIYIYIMIYIYSCDYTMPPYFSPLKGWILGSLGLYHGPYAGAVSIGLTAAGAGSVRIMEPNTTPRPYRHQLKTRDLEKAK